VIHTQSWIKLVVNHSKIATIKSADYKLLLRGSMNLNFNPRFEQLDVTEGGADYDLVKSIEDELEVLPMDAPGSAVYAQTKLASAFTQQTLDLFQGNGKGLKTWAK
jgi:hypothetical protein